LKDLEGQLGSTGFAEGPAELPGSTHIILIVFVFTEQHIVERKPQKTKRHKKY
jgi:hypothetical protein